MNLLEGLIHEMIIESGPISLETYMALALTHPVHGYYAAKIPLGKHGDFITAPEISQMFGELIGLWCIAMWRAIGEPRPLLLAELGPGRGTLIADALRAARVAPGFLSAIDLHLVETSEASRRSQRAALKDFGLAAGWQKTVEELPEGPAIIIANEFFDCLPVRQFIRRTDGWHERLVGLDSEGHLCFGLAPDPEPGLTAPGEAGCVFEASLAAARLMTRLAARITAQGGALLVVDYGYDTAARGETLQAVRRHCFADPLRDPGEADLTAHVDFCALIRAARAAGAEVYGPMPQGYWLTRLGLYERAARLREQASAGQRADIGLALQRLAGTGQGSGEGTMARLFKVLAVVKPGIGIPPGFEMAAA
ncbi:MAG: SAM-dependent methyltransferase [Beijerinckiaceae bacterium]|nr:SAM-dependent methyltransferase [Beijerinckiaceae bacterium]MCI0735159.1 SAM-dependent methyltransferase [Beijerinckiaceae bacterium]